MTGQPVNSPRKTKTRIFRPRTASNTLSALLSVLGLSVVVGLLAVIGITPILAVGGAATSSAISLFNDLPDHIDPSQVSKPSNIYAKDKEGKDVFLARFYAQNRQSVGWDQISQFVKDAAVSEEDPRFYTHAGVDPLAAARAVVQNVSGSGFSGASTITMQYVRNLLIQESELIPNEEERKAAYEEATSTSISRKLKEMRLAISIEKRYSKNDILLGYLNIANYGGTIYGIESAARAYFSKSAAELTLPEAASLVGIVNFPGKLNLLSPENYEANKERRDLILRSMLREEKITEQQLEEALKAPIVTKLSEPESGCSSAEANYGLGHFCDYVTRYLINDKKFGASPQERWFKFQNGGFKIYTTIDMEMQAAAVKSMRDNAPPNIRGIDFGSAATSVENATGRVLTMTQNRYFSDSKEFVEKHPDHTSVNYNTDFELGGSSGFQFGSTIKAFTMAAWLQSGHSLQERVNVSPRRADLSNFKGHCFPGGVYGYGSFSFQNASGGGGMQTALFAMDRSLNGGFVSMAEKMDMCKIFEIAEKMGLQRATEQRGNQSLPNYNTRNLTIVPAGVYNGTDEISPLRLATAYTGFANEGKVCTAAPIDKIISNNGQEVDFTRSECKQVLDANIANGVGVSLEHYITDGLAASWGRSPTGTPRMGKTGTTDNAKDSWMVGGTSKVTTASWTGNVVGDANMLQLNKHDAAQSIWAAITTAAERKYGGDKFAKPGANNNSSNATKKDVVPNVVGQSLATARQMLQAAGFNVAVGESVHSDHAVGTVAAQNPGGGAQASAGETVTISESKGPEAKRIPNGILGRTAQEASNLLNAAGYTSVTMQCNVGGSSPRADMQVLSASPSSGDEAPPGTPVRLIVQCR